MAGKKVAPAEPAGEAPDMKGRQEGIPSPVLEALRTGRRASGGSAADDIRYDEYVALKEVFATGEGLAGVATRTDLSMMQIIQMSRGLALAEYFGSAELKKFIYDIMLMSISKQRKSRKEFTAGLRSSMMGEGAEAANAFAHMQNKL